MIYQIVNRKKIKHNELIDTCLFSKYDWANYRLNFNVKYSSSEIQEWCKDNLKKQYLIRFNVVWLESEGDTMLIILRWK